LSIDSSTGRGDFVQLTTDSGGRIPSDAGVNSRRKASDDGSAAACGESTMRAETNRYFTVEQLEELAVAKYIEAALTPAGDEREELLVEAKRFASRAKMKSWLMCEIGIAPQRSNYH
jgi:hypothetical protein